MKLLFSIKSILLVLCCLFLILNIIFFGLMLIQEGKNNIPYKKTSQELQKEKLNNLKNQVDFNRTYFISGNKYVVYYGANNKQRNYP